MRPYLASTSSQNTASSLILSFRRFSASVPAAESGRVLVRLAVLLEASRGGAKAGTRETIKLSSGLLREDEDPAADATCCLELMLVVIR